MESSGRRVARAAALVMVAFAVSRGLGLVRQVVFGLYFGTGPAMDAYVAALRIPEAIFLIVAGGALGSAFIPLFTSRLATGRVDAAWRLASAVVNVLLVVLVPLSLLCILVAPWLARVVVMPAHPPEVQARAAALMRVMLLSTAIFGVSGIVMGILNAHQHFLLPAVAPVLYNLGLIGGAVVGGVTSLGVMGPAAGMVVGAVAHLLIQVPGLLRYGARYTPTLGREDDGVAQVGRLMAPRVLGVAAVQLNMVITNNLASYLGAGAISALDYAWRVMLLPQGVFAQAVGTAAFPTFSSQAARGEWAALRRTLAATLRTVLAVTLPATAGLIVLGRPIVALMFQYGEFDVASTRDVAWALAWFALGLAGHSALEVLARAFYAQHDTWTPALAGVLAVALNVGLGLMLPNAFRRLGYPAHGGLALANALAVLVETTVLVAVMHRRLGGFHVGRALAHVGRILLAVAGMVAVLWGWLRLAPPVPWVRGGGGVVVGLVAYVGLALALRVDELKQLVRMMLRLVLRRAPFRS
jgi:putative peptidoglycan lipid II flippase